MAPGVPGAVPTTGPYEYWSSMYSLLPFALSQRQTPNALSPERFGSDVYPGRARDCVPT